MVLLTWLAAHTDTIRLGTGVTLIGLHNPVASAKRFASLDQLCGGRLMFSVGVGWSEEEYECAVVPWRRRCPDGRLRRSHQMLVDDARLHYQGEFVSITDAVSYPKPVDAAGPPLFFGGNGEMTLRRVARTGNGWLGMNLSPDEVATRIDQIRSQALDLGRDPAAIEMCMLTSVFRHSGPAVTPNNAAAWVEAVAARTVDVALAATSSGSV